jgi:two-component system, NtrC family, sensor kinase
MASPGNPPEDVAKRERESVVLVPEAELLSARIAEDAEERQTAPGIWALPRGDSMSADIHRESISRVLTLLPPGISRQALRISAHRADLPVTLQIAASRWDFLDQVRGGSIDAIVAAQEGLPDLELREILDRARSAEPPIPVIVAVQTADEKVAVHFLRSGAAEVIPAADLAHFPTVLARALKMREFAIQQAAEQQELDRTAARLRDNQKLITLGRLAASITHEINNPLESITNLLYLLAEEQDLSQTSRGYLALAQRELERVAQIARQTLNFSRETSGPVRVHIDGLLEEVLSLYGRRIMEKNLRVERQYDCSEEATVYPGEMRQVLSNLVTNAIEASGLNGRLRLRIRCARSWNDPGVRGIRISIADTGSGISPEVQRRLGEPFFTTKGQRGTGLGLWVTRSIMQRYGGEIQLRSSVDPQRHGTVFSLFLPTNLRPQVVDRKPGAPENSSHSTFSASSPSGSQSRPRAEKPRRRA